MTPNFPSAPRRGAACLFLIGATSGALVACDTPGGRASGSGHPVPVAEFIAVHEWSARTLAWASDRRPAAGCSAMALAWSLPFVEPAPQCDPTSLGAIGD